MLYLDKSFNERYTAIMPKHEEPKPDDNKELVVHALEGTALVALTAYAARKILRDRRSHGSIIEPDDYVNSTVVKAMERSRQFRGEAHPLTWLHSILINTSKDELKKHRGRRSHEISTDPEPHLLSILSREDSPEKKVIVREQRERILEAIQKLSEQEQVVIFKFYFEGKTYEQIAAELRIKLGTVKSHASRGLAKLHAILGEEEVA